ncbi:TetR/AcrR family transcriptional regulator [Kineosporia babensis]|uniref:TetR/AcrR family transcriptional regulator n=1 Tax=Kineosporia babensis TaxID=499548 RepID=A0A9X1NNP6_9ACTN|nr:TetR/AcrR family transcriptional regulator [Kineosporia babensis]MCD5316491.1 TetR/AcrR family transcriptional regulator [Kineosporia babensis]
MAKPVGRRGETRERILATALDLFVEHGVHGTSLQQIADRLGVAKATVYHQFATKDALIQALVQPVADTLGELLTRAEAAAGREAQVEVVIEGLVEMVLARRQIAAVMHGDPAVEAAIRATPELAVRSAKVKDLLLGPDPSPSRRVALSVFNAGLMLSGTDPELAELPEEILRQELLGTARRLLV